MRTVRTLNIDLTRELKRAGMTDQEVCAWGYFKALQHEAEQICIIHPGGWERTYPMQDVRNMLRRTPDLQGEVNMGVNRTRAVKELEGGSPS